MDKKTENQLDMADYIEEAPEHEQIRDLGDLSDIEKKLLHMAGIDVNSRERLGSFLQKDHSVVHCSSGSDGAEILSTSAALEKYDGLEKYWWKAVGKTNILPGWIPIGLRDISYVPLKAQT
jgi:hypothetical protein